MKNIIKDIKSGKSFSEISLNDVFGKVFNNIHVGIAFVSKNGAWLKVNKAFCDFLGYSEKELLKTDFQSLTHSDSIEEDVSNVKKVLNREIDSYCMEKKYYRKDGSVFCAFLSVSAFFDDEKNVMFFVSIAQDVTSKAAIQENFDLIVNNSDLGFWEYDVVSGIVVSSIGVDKIFQRSVAKIEDFYSAVYEDDLLTVKENLNNTIKNGKDYLSEYRIVGPKIKYTRAIGKPIFDKFGKVYKIVGFNIDLTREKAIIDNLDIVNKNLEHFNYVISHDLKEPLRSISSFADLLNMDIESGNFKNVNRYVDLIKSRCNRIESLLSDLSCYSKCERYKPEMVNILDVLNEVLSILSDRILKLSVSVKYEKELFDFEIFYPKNGLFQIFQNLLDNAIKYEGKNIDISIRKCNQYIQINIKDDGIGMEEKFKDKIFNPFVRLNSKDKYGGSGLGLSVCKKIVNLNYGEIGLEGCVGGCDFWFTIPIDRRIT